MKLVCKNKLTGCVLLIILVALGVVIGGDVTVKEGTIEGEVFKSTDCTAIGLKAIAFGEQTTAWGDWSIAAGYDTAADGWYSTAMGYNSAALGDYSTAMGYETSAYGLYSTSLGCLTTASGDCSTAIGASTTASGFCSIAMGVSTQATGGTSMAMGQNAEAKGSCNTAIGYYVTAGPTSYCTSLGRYCNNNVYGSFAVGYGTYVNPKTDFRVESGVVTIGNVASKIGDLYVGHKVDANQYVTHSSFYDKDTYGKALDYALDCSKTIKLNAQGQKEYNHEADPQFLKTYVTVKDYDKYTDTKVWNDELKEYEPERIYETHQEIRTDLGMQVAWLRQCAFELKQENEQLKAELAAIKAKIGME